MKYDSEQVLKFMQNQFEGKTLEHMGILGMKWGRRKAAPTNGGNRLSRGTTKSLDQIIADRAKARADRAREKIMASPSKLYKNRHQFTDQEIQQAIGKMRMERELKQLNMDKMGHAVKVANTILSYGETAKKAYDLYNSPLGKLLKQKLTGSTQSSTTSTSSTTSPPPNPLRRGTGSYPPRTGGIGNASGFGDLRR